MADQRALWLVVLTTRDHAGDTAAIASVFSGRGIQIDSFIGFGSIRPSSGPRQGRIMITFKAFRERCHSLCLVLESLEAVSAVRCFGPDQIPTELIDQSRSIKQYLSALEGEAFHGSRSL
jgi:hypothetical protein